MALTEITNAWADTTIAAYSKVSVWKGPIKIAPTGNTDDNAGVELSDSFYADAGSVYAFRGPGYIEITAV